MVHDGDPAPDFALPAADGTTVRLGDLRGRYAVVYFYPKDDTTGCTKEALDFTERKSEFDALGAQILGISPDSMKAHAKFAAKHGLEVTLLADPERVAIEAYGVWAEKKMYGRAYMGVERSTFLIGPDGTVLNSWRGVKIPGHAADVLDALKKRQ
jgi:thioredoxin-dependent peroxiredoxin